MKNNSELFLEKDFCKDPKESLVHIQVHVYT